MENLLELKSINEIRKARFFIPSYQRGYRWTTQQVLDLLEDIWEFHNKRKSEDEFYCLQPIIVKQRDNDWEVIDGQQRLTTIFIILEAIGKKNFSIEYATRPGSQTFLQNLTAEVNEDNIDYYYISSAYCYCKAWFKKKEDEENEFSIEDEFNMALGKFTMLIWYQINDGSDPRDIFTRINLGKIPLTNAELIKALFLRRDHFGASEEQVKLHQLEIATEWDRMEYALQNNEFWYFVNKEHNELPTRIEFLFNLIADKKGNQDPYYTFLFFQNWFNKVQSIGPIWKEIKDCYLTLEGWFEDRQLYHLIGYLITGGYSIPELRKKAEHLSKTEFVTYLKEQISQVVDYDLEDLDFYEYNPNKAIEKILLLYNIETLLQNTTTLYRFPFNEYKGNGVSTKRWSLEHIHAQKSKGLDTTERRKKWLEEAKAIIKEMKIKAKDTVKQIDQLLGMDVIEREAFDALQFEVVSLFGDPNLHSIDNLTLLTVQDNAALNNSIFPVKRNKIIELEKKGSFIPICTRNVFLKYYTPNPEHLHFWSQQDRAHYRSNIQETLQAYLPLPELYNA